MWDLIVSVPDHCLSFYFNKTIHMLLNICLAALIVKHSRAVTKSDVSVSNLHDSKHKTVTPA